MNASASQVVSMFEWGSKKELSNKNRELATNLLNEHLDKIENPTVAGCIDVLNGHKSLNTFVTLTKQAFLPTEKA